MFEAQADFAERMGWLWPSEDQVGWMGLFLSHRGYRGLISDCSWGYLWCRFMLLKVFKS